MKLYIYHCLDNERVPEDMTHAIIGDCVTIIKGRAFYNHTRLVSVMSDSVKKFERFAFYGCRALRFIRLSKTLEFIGFQVFYHCESL